MDPSGPTISRATNLGAIDDGDVAEEEGVLEHARLAVVHDVVELLGVHGAGNAGVVGGAESFEKSLLVIHRVGLPGAAASEWGKGVGSVSGANR